MKGVVARNILYPHEIVPFQNNALSVQAKFPALWKIKERYDKPFLGPTPIIVGVHGIRTNKQALPWLLLQEKEEE
jgi:hypothetical protein